MNNSSNPTISVVVPLYNEQESIEPLFIALTNILEKRQQNWELLLVNDGSNDDSAAIIDILSDDNDHVHSIHFSRNFGKEAALDAGLVNAHGDCIIFIDADMQHPPLCIEQMLDKWLQGYDVVNGIKKQRGDVAFFHRGLAFVFNRIMTGATGENFQGASDFKLIDRCVAEALMQCSERVRFFRGLVAWVGFKTTSVEFDVVQRTAGNTKWSRSQLIKYSLTNIVSFSTFPLILVTWIGAITVFLGVILGVQTLYNYFSGIAFSGFTTVIMLLILLCGIILLSLGTISLYIAKIYDEQKARPLYIIADTSRDRRKRHPNRGL